MARAIGQGHKIIGLIECVACTKEMPAKLTGGGKLSLCCTWCDLPLYVNRGTKAFDLLMAKVKLDAPPAAAAASSSPAAGAAAASSEKQTTPAADNKQDPRPPRPRALFGGS